MSENGISGLKKIVLYGAGKRCHELCDVLKESDVQVAFIADSNPDKWGEEMCGIPVASPEKLKKDRYPFCITMQDSLAKQQVRERLYTEYGYGSDLEIPYFELLIKAFCFQKRIRKCAEDSIIQEIGERKVVFACNRGFTLGGIEEWVKEITMALIKAGYSQVSVLADNGKYDVPSCLMGHVERVSIDHNYKFSKNNIYKLVDCLLHYLPCVVVTSKIDEIMLASVILKKFYPDKVRIVAGIHSGEEGTLQQYFDIRKYIDLYVGVSRDIVDGMETRGIAREKIRYMTCPVKCEDGLRRSYTVNRLEAIKIGYAGRVEKEQKRMDLLIELLEELTARHVNYKCVSAGSGSFEDKIANYIEQNNLQEKVELVGYIERKAIPDFWTGLDICINLADYEGRSISVMEAMANGAVPIVTNTSGVHDDIKEGENGYIYNLGDYRGMAGAIEYLEKNRNLLGKMGKKAYEAILAKSGMEKHIQLWEEILEFEVEKKSLSESKSLKSHSEEG